MNKKLTLEEFLEECVDAVFERYRKYYKPNEKEGDIVRRIKLTTWNRGRRKRSGKKSE